MPDLEFRVRGALTATEAALACGWRCDLPYDIYDGDESPGYFLDPANRYAAIVTQTGDFAGYLCVGEEARVPGGDYDPGEPEVLEASAEPSSAPRSRSASPVTSQRYCA